MENAFEGPEAGGRDRNSSSGTPQDSRRRSMMETAKESVVGMYNTLSEKKLDDVSNAFEFDQYLPEYLPTLCNQIQSANLQSEFRVSDSVRRGWT